MSPKKIADTIRKIVFLISYFFITIIIYSFFLLYLTDGMHHIWILSTLQMKIDGFFYELHMTKISDLLLIVAPLVFPFAFIFVFIKLEKLLQVIDILASENEAANPRTRTRFGMFTATTSNVLSKWRWFNIPILLLYFVLAHLLSILISIPLALILGGILTIL